MKYIFLFIVAVLFGLVITILYTAPKVSPTPERVLTPVATQSAMTSSFSLPNAPTESIRGSISTMSGAVNWESRIATQPAKLVVPAPLQQGETLQTGDDGKVEITFPNVVSIKQSAKTQINFIQMLPTNSIISQGYGTTEYIQQGNTPLAVRSFGLLTEIHGDVVITVDKDEDQVIIDVKTGSIIAAFNDLNYLSNVIPVSAGNEFIYDDDTREETIE